jgi:peroxiredoxin
MAEVGVGEKVPYFELADQQGYPWSLSGELELGPVVLVFYRGDWCAYCNGQLASYARRFEEFEERSAGVAGVSVDPPENNARMVGKLLLPFPLLSDPRGDLIKRLGLWDAEEGVAVPSVIVLDRSGEIRYLYSGSDFADRPDEEEALAALKGIPAGIERNTGEPEILVTAREAREDSVRPDKPQITLDQLLTYFRGAFSATIVLAGRFGGWGRSGRKAFKETNGYQTLVRAYRKALEDTAALRREVG